MEYIDVYNLTNEMLRSGRNDLFIVDMNKKYENFVIPEKKYIAILGGGKSLLGSWDANDVKGGIPGSEECVIYLSNELAKRGYVVHNYMNPYQDSLYRLPMANPRYLDSTYYVATKNKYIYDVVILWRMYSYPLGSIRGKKIYIWVHDMIWNTIFNPLKSISLKNIDGLMLLTECSRDNIYNVFNGVKSLKYVLNCSGVETSQFSNPMKFTNACSIGYYSNYGRGLKVLLENWDKILKAVPEATLSIAYGRQTWWVIPEIEVKRLVGLINKYPKSIKEVGKIGHMELAKLMKETSVWAYPYITNDETFCITAVKAQLAGNIPVIYRRDSLKETVEPSAPSLDKRDDERYINLLINILTECKKNRMEQMRQKYIEFASQFSWGNCVDRLIKFWDIDN